MSKAISVRLSSNLRVKMLREAKEKNCSLSELLRRKIMFAYEQEEKEKTMINLKKIEGDLKSLMNLLILNSALLAENIRKEKGVDAWKEIFKTAKEAVDDYKKKGRLAI